MIRTQEPRAGVAGLPNVLAANADGGGDTSLGQIATNFNLPVASGAPAGAIVTRLVGSDIATALGLTAQSSSPVLLLCRRLVDAGHDPATLMHAYRGDTLALIVRSIGDAARLEIRGDGVGFRPSPKMGAASPIAPNASARTRHRAMPGTAE
jgi:hypothetical protein